MKKSKNFVPLTVNFDEVERFAKLITGGWQKATASILAVAKLCAEADKSLKAEEKRELISKLPFGSSVFSKLVVIGGDKRLAKQSVAKLLPPSYSVIYEVSHLDDKKLGNAITQKILNPRVRRSDVIAYASASKAKSSNLHKQDDRLVFAKIVVSKNSNRESIMKILELLEQIEVDEHISVQRMEDDPRYVKLVDKIEAEFSAMHHRTLLKMKSLLAEEIRKLIKKKGSLKKTGFIEDEISLNVPDSELEQRLLDVLETLGRERDLTFLRRKAEEIVDYSKYNKLISKMEQDFPFVGLYSEMNSRKSEIKVPRTRDISELKQKLLKLKV